MPTNQYPSNLQSQAMVDVFNERQRQIETEGYSTAMDDSYKGNELVRASAGYVDHVVGRSWTYNKEMPEVYQNEEVPEFWPWDDSFWKPKSPRNDLVRAAALLIAEIERIDRKLADE